MPRLDSEQQYPRSRGSRKLAGLAFVVAVGLLGAGCSGGQTGKASPTSPVSSSPAASPSLSPTPSPSPAATTSASAAAPRTYTQKELASRPCQALDARDLAALGIKGRGKQEVGDHGASCMWKLAGQSVSLAVDLPLSYARTMTKNGRVSQVPVGQHNAIQAEFQNICFIFVAVDDIDRLVGTTTIPERGVSQDGTCPAGASVAAAALTHLR
ncbi:DUF3558 family protein [Strepomyces sp. STD 3.1]|uniref:DUF3558 family protein n=1 Tax=Streptomyces sp. NPDC058985 TaxID=3346684 RepID=UPI001F1A011D|nr:DUF3558 family protein [Streptomyces sp. STD 3.1]